jgi:hypothetical protein
MVSENSFPTKRGRAYFTEEAVRFEESFLGYLGNLYSEYWKGGTYWKMSVFFGYLLAYPAAVWGVWNVYRRGGFVSVLAITGALAAAVLLGYARGFRSPDSIRLDAIEEVSATRGSKGLTRPRLVIRYSDEGSTYRRRVNLPSLYTSEGEETYEHAQKAFEGRGFILNQQTE